VYAIVFTKCTVVRFFCLICVKIKCEIFCYIRIKSSFVSFKVTDYGGNGNYYGESSMLMHTIYSQTVKLELLNLNSNLLKEICVNVSITFALNFSQN